MLDVRRMDCVSDVFIFRLFKGYSALGVQSGRRGRAAWADYKKPSGGRPEGLRGLNAM